MCFDAKSQGTPLQTGLMRCGEGAVSEKQTGPESAFQLQKRTSQAGQQQPWL